MTKIILPGELVDVRFTTCVLGPGLSQTETNVRAIQGGILRSQETARSWWIESNKKRYVPALGEPVIGQITSRHAEEYRVDIGVGALIYARISLADKDMEPELECINPSTGKSEGYGELTDGFMVTCSLAHSLRLLRPNAAALTALGQHIPFEVAVGMNGRVWIRADTIAHTILGANMITRSESIYSSIIPPSVLASGTTVKEEDDNAMQVDSRPNYTKLELDACRQLIKQLIQQF
ncbi:hypothetical protein BDF22DRAFT_672278 [Syncephalis plumigaleata]|nr:hypothetical protein BDF22DRAFT_672278 [Syncephalis plumigaleata]